MVAGKVPPTSRGGRPPRSFLLALLGGALQLQPGSALTSGGAACPCISPDMTAWTDAPSGRLRARTGLKNYLYDATYGAGACAAWDAAAPPTCALADGTPMAGRPDWCEKQWCFVDVANCAADTRAARSTYFPGGAGLYYSYRTCGESNSFDSWGSELLPASQVKVSMENVLRTLKRELEAHWADLTSGSPSVTTSSCPALFDFNTCTACDPTPSDSVWATASDRMNFGRMGSFMDTASATSATWKCMGEATEAAFLRFAQSEYDMQTRDRIAYLYAGFATAGNYMQWPAMLWERETYDPRYRPWYAMIASGPKNVVLVLDTSGSMTGTRLVMAKQAAVKVLDTLVWVDYFLVMAFSAGVTGHAQHLIPASEANIASAKAWIGGLEARGTTNFVDALSFSMGKARRAAHFEEGAGDPDHCFSAHCQTVLLFLSDGVPDAWSSADRAALAAQNSDGKVALRTYALGSGADATVLDQLAADHGGASVVSVADGGNLGNAMANYYKSMESGRDVNRIRWMTYTDVVSGVPLLAGCASLESTSSALLGVVCMDANVIAPLTEIRQLDGYLDLAAAIEQGSRMCSDGANPYLEMTNLQCSSKWETVTLCPPGDDCLFAEGEEGSMGAVVGDNTMGTVVGILVAWCCCCTCCLGAFFLRKGPCSQLVQKQNPTQMGNPPQPMNPQMMGSPQPRIVAARVVQQEQNPVHQ